MDEILKTLVIKANVTRERAWVPTKECIIEFNYKNRCYKSKFNSIFYNWICIDNQWKKNYDDTSIRILVHAIYRESAHAYEECPRLFEYFKLHLNHNPMYHKTKDWDSILISDMTDDHLKNTITSMCKRITDAFAIYSWNMKEDITTITAWVDLRRWKENSKDIISNTTKHLATYIMEATIRWLDIRETLTTALWREAKTDIQNSIMSNNLLNSPQENYYPGSEDFE